MGWVRLISGGPYRILVRPFVDSVRQVWVTGEVWRKLVTLGLVLVLLVLLTIYLKEPVKHWRSARAVRQAQIALQATNYASAMIFARRALMLNRTNLAALKVVGDTAQLQRNPQELVFRLAVADLEPDQLKNQELLAYAALRLGRFAIAEKARDKMALQDQDSDSYHEIAGSIAFKLGRSEEAEKHFSVLVERQPENPNRRLNLAKIRLFSPEPETADLARSDLELISEDPDSHRQALNLLIRDALLKKQITRAVGYAIRLQADPAAEFKDVLQCLSVMFIAEDEQQIDLLAKVKEMAKEDSNKARDLIIWLNHRNRSREAQQWAQGLPEDIQSTFEVQRRLAESYRMLGDWAGLAAWVEACDWSEDDMEYFRLAYLALAINQGKKEFEDKDTLAVWDQAMDATQQKSYALEFLGSLAASWGWYEQARDTWWRYVRVSNNPRHGLDVLGRHYMITRNTAGLLRVARELHKLNSEDLANLNNLIMYRLLLNRNVEQAHSQAKTLYQQKRYDPVYLSTYCFSLHLQGRTQEALELFSKLRDEDLRQPAYAAYYGIFLASLGQSDRAIEFLNLAAERPQVLLPEESNLVETYRTLAVEFHDLQTAYDENPADPVLATRFAMTLYRQGKSQAAVDLFRQTARDHPQVPLVVAHAAVILATTGAWQESWSVLAQCRDTFELFLATERLQKGFTSPSADNQWHRLGLLLELKKTEIQRNCKFLYQEDPQNPNYASTYALSLFRQGNLQQGLKVLDELSETARAQSLPTIYRSIIQALLGRIDQAAPSLTAAQASSTVLLVEEEQILKQAIALVEEFREIEKRFVEDPDDWANRCRYALAIHRQGKTEEALALLNPERDSNVPPATPAAACLAILLADVGRSEEARKILIGSGATREFYEETNRWYGQEGLQHLPSLKNQVAWLGSLVDSENSVLLTMAQDLYLSRPRDPEYLRNYSYLLHLNGKSSEAITLLKSIPQHVLGLTPYATYYGILLISQNEWDEAKTYLDASDPDLLLPEERRLLAEAQAKVRASEQ